MTFRHFFNDIISSYTFTYGKEIKIVRLQDFFMYDVKKMLLKLIRGKQK